MKLTENDSPILSHGLGHDVSGHFPKTERVFSLFLSTRVLQCEMSTKGEKAFPTSSMSRCYKPLVSSQPPSPTSTPPPHPHPAFPSFVTDTPPRPSPPHAPWLAPRLPPPPPPPPPPPRLTLTTSSPVIPRLCIHLDKGRTGCHGRGPY